MNTQAMFCLDANVFIQGWYQIYPPDLFPDTWKLLVANKCPRLESPYNAGNAFEYYEDGLENLIGR